MAIQPVRESNMRQELVLDFYRYTIPSWAVVPLEYGDYSGLSDTGIKHVEDFMRVIDEKVGSSLHSIEYGDEVSYRNFNDFHNIGDDCVDCKVYFTTLFHNTDGGVI